MRYIPWEGNHLTGNNFTMHRLTRKGAVRPSQDGTCLELVYREPSQRGLEGTDSRRCRPGPGEKE